MSKKNNMQESSADQQDIKRVAFLCSKLEGGIGRNIIRLGRDFSRRGIRVEIWSVSPAVDFKGEIPEAVNFRVLPSSHAVAGVLWLIKFIFGFRPDVVVTPSERFTRIAYRASKLFARRPLVVACVHNYYTKFYENISLAKQKKRKRLIREIYSEIDAVVCVSRGVAQDLRDFANFSSNNIVTIYNPIIDEYLCKNSATLLPAELDLAKPMIVNVGAIENQKNQKFLLQCYEELRESIDCSLVLVGDGATQPVNELETLIKKSRNKKDIFWVGHQADPFTYIEKAKVFAFTSKYEGFGNVVVESLMFGTPVVSTASGGPSEILIDPRLGEIVDTDDPKVFAAVLKVWLERDADEAFMKDYAVTNFSVSTIADQYIELFEKLSH